MRRTPPLLAPPTEGLVAFSVSVRVDMSEFATWQSDRLSAFFDGLAQILAAERGSG